MEDMYGIWKLINNKGNIQCEGYLIITRYEDIKI